MEPDPNTAIYQIIRDPTCKITNLLWALSEVCRLLNQVENTYNAPVSGEEIWVIIEKRGIWSGLLILQQEEVRS